MRNGVFFSIVWLVLLGGMTSVAIATTGSTHHVASQQEVRALTSGERVRLQRMVRDMESAMQTIDAQGLAPFQDEAYVQRWRNLIERFRSDLLRLPQGDEPDLQAAAMKLAEFEAVVAFGAREGAKQADELGDVQVTLAAIERELRANRPPQWSATLIMNRRRDTGTHWYEVGRAGFAWVMHRGADGGYPVVPGRW